MIHGARAGRWVAVSLVLLLAAASVYAAPYAARPVSLDRHDPEMVALDPEGRRAFVAHADCALPGVSIIDTRTLKVLQYLDAETMVTRVAFDERTGKLYAASNVGLAIYLWDDPQQKFLLHKMLDFAYRDTDCGDDDIVVTVTCMALNRTRNELYLAKTVSPPSFTGAQNFARVDLAAEQMEEIGLQTITQVWGMEVDEPRATIYLADFDGGGVLALDAATLRTLRYISTGAAPYDVKLVSATGPVLYVTNQGDGTVSVIEGKAETQEIRVGYSPRSILLHPQASRAYVTAPYTDPNNKPGCVHVIDTTRHMLVKSIPVGLYPVSLAASATFQRLAVCNRSENTVTVIDTASDTPLQSLKTGTEPYAIAFHPVLHKAYFVCRSGNAFSMLAVPADADDSSVTAVPAELAMTPTESSALTVIPRDADNVDLGPGWFVEIFSTAPRLVRPEVTDEGDGRYTQDLESIDASWLPPRTPPLNIQSITATVSARVDGLLLSKHPTVVYSQLGAPRIKIIEPNWGFTGGGRTRISGENFGESTPRVYFDGLLAVVDSYDRLADPQLIDCTFPPHPEGFVDVVVEREEVSLTPAHYSHALAIDGFLYVDPGDTRLTCLFDRLTRTVTLLWEEPAERTARRIERSQRKDFGSGLTVFEGVFSPFEDSTLLDAAGAWYYRVAE